MRRTIKKRRSPWLTFQRLRLFQRLLIFCALSRKRCRIFYCLLHMRIYGEHTRMAPRSVLLLWLLIILQKKGKQSSQLGFDVFFSSINHTLLLQTHLQRIRCSCPSRSSSDIRNAHAWEQLSQPKPLFHVVHIYVYTCGLMVSKDWFGIKCTSLKRDVTINDVDYENTESLCAVRYRITWLVLWEKYNNVVWFRDMKTLDISCSSW